MTSANTYLRAMGITPWVLRDASVVPVPPEPESSALAESEWELQSCDHPVAHVVVAWPDKNLSMDTESPAVDLLCQILTALRQPLDRFRVVGWAEGDAAPRAVDAPVFCFADDRLVGDPDWVVLPSLERMLSQGKAVKGPAWLILKLWIPRLAG